MEASAETDAGRIRNSLRQNAQARTKADPALSRAAETPIGEIASRYDVRNLRASEMESLCQELYAIKAIGFQDRALLTLQGSDLPDAHGRNYVQIWQDTIDRHLGFGINRQAVDRAKRLQKILLHIDQLHQASATGSPCPSKTA